MAFYECVFIARQDLTSKQVETLTEELSKVITDNGGKVVKTEQWGLRNLAYRINKQRKGYYILMELDTPPAAMLEMTRLMGLNEDVVRNVVIKLEELTDGPSVQFDKEAA